MIEQTLFASSPIEALEQVVQFSQRRHGVLAGNVANFDTPGYRVRDLSPERFQARLKQALAARDRAESSSWGDASRGAGHSLAELSQSKDDILFHDDSNGTLEHQVAQISKNQMQHNLAMTILTSQFRLLQAAITERA